VRQALSPHYNFQSQSLLILLLYDIVKKLRGMPAYQSHINLTHINYLKLDRKTLSAISMSIELKVTPIKSSGLKITDKGVHNGL
ncbi:MAG: hypothetical protein QQN41_08175, partial [Nitrosopumilus sp.]